MVLAPSVAGPFWRWGQRYDPENQRRVRPRLRSTNDSWRLDETYIRANGRWVYCRAVDSSGATIDFLFSAKRDVAAAERFLAKPLDGENYPAQRVIQHRRARRLQDQLRLLLSPS